MKTNDCHLFENYTHHTYIAVTNICIQISHMKKIFNINFYCPTNDSINITRYNSLQYTTFQFSKI